MSPQIENAKKNWNGSKSVFVVQTKINILVKTGWTNKSWFCKWRTLVLWAQILPSCMKLIMVRISIQRCIYEIIVLTTLNAQYFVATKLYLSRSCKSSNWNHCVSGHERAVVVLILFANMYCAHVVGIYQRKVWLKISLKKLSRYIN